MATIQDVQQNVEVEDWPKLSGVRFFMQVSFNYVSNMGHFCDIS